MAAAVVCLALTACAAPTKTLYVWDGYQSSLYQFLKSNGADAGQQIPLLEAQIRKNADQGLASPPGLHGHLALLYSRAGDDVNAIRHLEIERRLFPESAVYVDFLLKNAVKSGAKS